MLKAGGNAHVMNTYRDLWIVPQGQKILMRMLNVEYERVARKKYPDHKRDGQKIMHAQSKS